MATLTETAYYTRRFINLSIFTIIFLIIFKIAWGKGVAWWRKNHPPPPPPPTVSFGKLPKIQFPQQKKLDLSYRLETPSGGLPDFGPQAKVYFIPAKKPNLLALERAKILARNLGFIQEPEKISETVYRWTNYEGLVSILEMDIITQNFQIKKQWQEDQSILINKRLPNQEMAIMEAENFLQKAGLLYDDLKNGTKKVSFWKFTPQALTPVLSLSEADFVKVVFLRASLDEMPIMPPNPQKGLISVLISGSTQFNKRILEVEFSYAPVLKDTFGTYPLKTPAQAWEELKAGKAFVANLGNNQKEITIRRVYLAYFESNQPQEYLQPIYVFEGDNNFVAYVPAITNQWTE
jgi:hypothetical protein